MRSVIVACGVLASANFLPSSALALEPRQCLPMAEMNAALRAEGQRTLIIGDRMDYEGQRLTFGDTTMTRAEWRDLTRQLRSDTQVRRDLIARMRRDGKTQREADAYIARILGVTAILERGDPDSPVPRVMTAFAANSDGSVGYSLEGDRPRDQRSTRVCVVVKFTNVRLARRSAARAASPDTYLFTGDSVASGPDGTSRAGATGAVIGNGASGEMTFVLLVPGGAPRRIFTMERAELTPAALSMMSE